MPQSSKSGVDAQHVCQYYGTLISNGVVGKAVIVKRGGKNEKPRETPILQSREKRGKAKRGKEREGEKEIDK